MHCNSAYLRESMWWVMPVAMKADIEFAVAFLRTSTTACGVTQFMGLIGVGLASVPTRERRETVSSR